MKGNSQLNEHGKNKDRGREKYFFSRPGIARAAEFSCMHLALLMLWFKVFVFLFLHEILMHAIAS